MSNTGTASMGGGASGPHTVDTDTFAEAVSAVAEGVDSFGNAYAEGDPIITFPNGQTVNVAPSPTYGACDIDGNVTSPAPDDATFLTDAIVKRECVNDNLEMETTTKGGGVQKEVWRQVRPRETTNSFIIDATTPVGELYHADLCRFVPASSCGGSTTMTGFVGVNGSGDADGFLALRFFASTNGGATFTPVTTNGLAEIDLGQNGESHPTSVFFTFLPSGGGDLCFRSVVVNNQITAGRVDPSVQSAYFTHMECRTC